MLRCLIERVEVTRSGTGQQTAVAIRWAGGFESRHELCRAVFAYKQLDNYEELLARLGALRGAGWRAPRIAEQLNAEGFRTPKQRGAFTADVVRSLFPRLAGQAEGENASGPQPPQWSADALAERLGIRVKKLKDWVRCGWVQALERPFDGVWILHADERELKRLECRVALSRKGRHYPADLDGEPV
ncbi:hypothetical protein V5E97_08365 [Singulisphaera sp. Ch08]